MLVRLTVTRPWTYQHILVAGAAALAGAASFVAAPDMRGAMGAALALLMTAIAVIDARSFIIPNELNAAGLALALLHAGVQNPQVVLEALSLALLRGAFVALIFLALRVGYRLLRGREGIGLGDVKLAGVAGAWLDPLIVALVIENAAVMALATYLVRQQALGRSIRPVNRLPFGLFFAPSIWLGWFLQTTWLAPLQTLFE